MLKYGFIVHSPNDLKFGETYIRYEEGFPLTEILFEDISSQKDTVSQDLKNGIEYFLKLDKDRVKEKIEELHSLREIAYQKPTSIKYSLLCCELSNIIKKIRKVYLNDN